MKPAGIDLTIEQLEVSDAATLRRLWVDVKGSAPPRTFTARLMRLALAWEVQAASTAGETMDVQRNWRRAIRHRCAQRDRNNKGSACRATLAEGTRLLKEWGGTTHEVLVTADCGASWKGQNYRSLSAVARAMTGTNRNGPKFFGLREQEKA